MNDNNVTMFIGATNVTGEPFTVNYNTDQNYIFISEEGGPMSGADNVSVERLGADGNWKSYPATVYTAADAWTVDYPSGSECRIIISSTVPLTVEFAG